MNDTIASAKAVAAADAAIIDFLESDGRRFSSATRLTSAARGMQTESTLLAPAAPT